MGGTPQPVPVRGTTTLPPGFPLATADLRAGTAWQGGPLAPDGTFATQVLSGGAPLVAWLRHAASGRLTLMGFVGQGQNGIGARGTAVALLFLSLGLGALSPAAQRGAIAQLEAHAAVASLADTIARRVAANPFAVADADPQILTALKNAFDALTSGSRAARLLGLGTTRAETIDPIVSISPDTALSNAQVIRGTDGKSIQAKNLGRRPCVAYTYRIGDESMGGVRTTLSRAARVGQPQEMPAVSSLLTGAFTLGEKSGWQPVLAPPVPLTLTANARKTFFETVVLMASGKTEADGDPNVFSQSRYADEVAEWRARRATLNQHAWVGGVLYDLIGTAIGGASTLFTADVFLKFKAALEAAEVAASQEILEFAAKGYFGRATMSVMQRAIGSDIVGLGVRRGLLSIVGMSEAAGAAVFAEAGVAVAALAEVVVGVLLAAGTLLALADLGTTYVDLLSSSKAERWETTLFQPTLDLTPRTVTLPVVASLTTTADAAFTASVPGFTPAAGEKIVYAWETDFAPSEGFLVGQGGAGSGQKFETEANTVTLSSAMTIQATRTVTVKAFLVAPDNTRRLVGESRANVQIDDKRLLTHGRYATKVFDNFARAYMVVPRRADAVSYSIYAHGFNDTAYYGTSIRRTIPEPPGYAAEDSWGEGKFQTPSEIWTGLSAGSSANPSEFLPWLDGRFGGMIVEVTVFLK